MAASAAATVRMKNTNTCPASITEEIGKGDEVHVDGQQHQLDRHQQDDDVLAVQEDTRDAQAKQDGAQY